MVNNKKTISELESELKKKTGEDKLPKKGFLEIKNKFDASKFIKLAEEVKKIFTEDEHHPSSISKAV